MVTGTDGGFRMCFTAVQTGLEAQSWGILGQEQHKGKAEKWVSRFMEPVCVLCDSERGGGSVTLPCKVILVLEGLGKGRL